MSGHGLRGVVPRRGFSQGFPPRPTLGTPLDPPGSPRTLARIFSRKLSRGASPADLVGYRGSASAEDQGKTSGSPHIGIIGAESVCYAS